MKAMVLAAGYGTRLGDLTRETPKPKLDVEGRPLLEHILRHLAAQGVEEVIVNLHFHPEAIIAHFGDGSGLGLRITYSREPVLLGTAGALRKVAGHLRGGPFLVQYGDVVTDMDLRALLDRHREGVALATLLLHRRAGSNSAIRMDDAGRITAFLERPSEEERRTIESPWVNSGICVLSPEILDHIPSRIPSDLPRDVFAPLTAGGRLFGVPLRGYRCAVDSPARLEELRAAIREGRCRFPWSRRPALAHAPISG